MGFVVLLVALLGLRSAHEAPMHCMPSSLAVSDFTFCAADGAPVRPAPVGFDAGAPVAVPWVFRPPELFRFPGRAVSLANGYAAPSEVDE